ncbi:flagellar assembly protein A [Hydrogenimonas thermophila]|uniref:Uncharacterized conserved protein, DUF342 family n=1 Tax=Hydrogenimonas thermophila TaxID=223786 RepID=A0A1I5PVN3_9BACT|nr:flagellar assembly protein A [Hydrogenimonas thermophila]SFP38153.1 Uncharacterized conserved protein, DUF342 family [Hydrogenimonas thermophila]
MGLFDVFKSSKDSKSSKAKTKNDDFTPFVIKTDNISQALHNAAKKYSLSTARLDFILLSYHTLVKMDPNDPDWTEIEHRDWNNFNQPKIILNPNVLIKQTYEIEIIKHKEEPWCRDLQLHIMTNKEKNRISAILKAGSKLIETEDLFNKLKNNIHKQMMRAGMLIELWEVDYDNALNEICAQVRVNKQYLVPEDIKFDVAQCYPSIQSIDSQLIMHYKNKQDSVDQNDRIDYSKRGYVQAVEKGEMIIEYIKAKSGIPGRNCKGEFIPVAPPKDKERPNFNVSDNIAVIEDESKIIYKAQRGGYVVFNNNTYDIQDEMQIDEVSFKKTGSIDAGVETEVKLHIHEKDAIKDAIGTGLEVEAEEVKVEGNVGASSKVTGEKVYIGGQTHKTSEIFAKYAKINVHKGFLRTETAEVTRLEGGKVEARHVKVQQAIGGEIKAMDIVINKIGSNVKLYAISSIEIEDMLGENNKIVIDANEIPVYNKELTELKEKKEKLKKKIRKIEEELSKLNKIKEKSEPAVKTLKQKIVQDKAKGIKPQTSFIIKIKQFQQLIEKVEEKNLEYTHLKDEMKIINTKLLTYQEMVLNAKIINRGVWKDFTEVEYQLLNPPQRITYYPKAGEKNQELYLKEQDDGMYQILAKKASN